MPAPRGLPRLCSTKGTLLLTFHQIPKQCPLLLPPHLPRLPSTCACTVVLQSTCRGVPSPASIWSCGLQQLPAGPPPSAFVWPRQLPRPAFLPLLPDPVPGQATFPCTCNPITNCPISLEMIPPEGTASLPADSYSERN